MIAPLDPTPTVRLPWLIAIAAVLMLASSCGDSAPPPRPDIPVDTDQSETNPDQTPDEVEPDQLDQTEVPDVDLDDIDPTLDTDQDGITDVVELATGTNHRSSDTDEDGLLDGDEDANKNGTVDPGETDPRKADTDNDRLEDDVELAGCSDPLIPDSDGDGILDGVEDASGNGVYDANRGETNLCDPDSDGDGLFDGCEDVNHDGRVDAGETDPRIADTDADGLSDGDECSGLRTNVDCSGPGGSTAIFDDAVFCPTDPRKQDTDGDGLTDPIELNSNYRNGAVDPRNPDSDGDGIPDGLEDLNRNGQWDEDLGELDPTTDTTYPGKLDADNPIGDACKLDQLRPVQDIIDTTGDWLFLAEPDYLVSTLTLNGNTDVRRVANAIDHPSEALAAFIISKQPELGANSAASESDELEARIGLIPFFPRNFSTWDGFDAFQATYEVSGFDSVRAARDDMIAQLLDFPIGDISGLPTHEGSPAATLYEVELSIVYRTSSRVILFGTVVAADQPISENLQIAINDLTNGTALAQDIDEYSPYCELFSVTQLPLADFIFTVDDTASMREEQDVIRDAADAIFDAINQSFISARWAFNTTEYEGGGVGVSAINLCGMLRDVKGENGSVWSSFEDVKKADFQCKVKDPGGIQNCDPPPDDFFGGREYGLKCPRIAVDYVQGRTNPAGVSLALDRQRQHAALIMIIMTDEEEYEVLSGALSEDAAVALYDDWFNNVANGNPSYGRTVPFAIMMLDNTMRTFERLFIGPPQLVPGAVTADLTDTAAIPTVIQNIISAAGGIASSYNPRSRPITVTMKVVIRKASDGSLLEIPHSLSNGWDYDPFGNSMVFFGDQRPILGDDFALSYQFFVKKCLDPNGCSVG